MQHLEEGTIHAWLDGALSPAERDDIARHVADCAECAERVAEARGVIAGASRIVSSLDVVRGNVIPAGPSSAPRPLWRRLHLTPARAALAASVLVAVSAMLAVRHEPRDMRMKAAPTVAAASPASAPAPAPAPAAAAAVADSPVVPVPTPAREARTQRLATTDTTTRVMLAPSPAPPAPAQAKTAEMRVARADSMAVDSVRGARAFDVVAARKAMAAPAVAAGVAGTTNQLRAMPFADASRNTCYRLDLDTSSAFKTLPERFVLQRDDAGRNIVRAVTPDGRVDSVLAGSDWQSRAPELVVRFTAPRATMLTFTSTSTRAEASSGAERGVVNIHRAYCRP